MKAGTFVHGMDEYHLFTEHVVTVDSICLKEDVKQLLHVAPQLGLRETSCIHLHELLYRARDLTTSKVQVELTAVYLRNLCTRVICLLDIQSRWCLLNMGHCII